MNKKLESLKNNFHTIIFESDTKKGLLFDLVLLFLIIISVIAVTLESVSEIRINYKKELLSIEWILTVIFTFEFLLRTWVVKKPKKYILSFYGIIDFISILPTYLSLLIPGSQTFLIIRVLRLFRVFRLLKISRFLNDSHYLANSIRASIPKITVFLYFVLLLTIIIGGIMYVIEGSLPNSQFNNIPNSIYWAVVTLTTVGYGDITPITPLGKVFASIVMILGYGVIAVPTGIVSVEFVAGRDKKTSTQVCKSCQEENHLIGAHFCHKCGEELS